MVANRGVVHPRLAGTLTPGFYPSTIAIERSTSIQDPSGEPQLTWTAVTGLEAIPAAIAVFNRQAAAELRRADGTIVTDSWQISLAGYWPEIQAADRIQNEAGEFWDILGVEHDSHQQLTRLKAERIH